MKTGEKMNVRYLAQAAIVGAAALLVGCAPGVTPATPNAAQESVPVSKGGSGTRVPASRIWDFFNIGGDANAGLEVNRFLWNASLDVLNFLPIESVDPFTGVIVYGYGLPPGGGTAYRGTVYISSPALDARSLNVALQTRSGPVSADTRRAIEDAILSRARQLRIAGGRR